MTLLQAPKVFSYLLCSRRLISPDSNRAEEYALRQLWSIGRFPSST